jgi:hypothetical protein
MGSDYTKKKDGSKKIKNIQSAHNMKPQAGKENIWTSERISAQENG